MGRVITALQTNNIEELIMKIDFERWIDKDEPDNKAKNIFDICVSSILHNNEFYFDDEIVFIDGKKRTNNPVMFNEIDILKTLPRIEYYANDNYGKAEHYPPKEYTFHSWENMFVNQNEGHGIKLKLSMFEILKQMIANKHIPIYFYWAKI